MAGNSARRREHRGLTDSTAGEGTFEPGGCADLSAPIDTKKHEDEWRKTLEELNTLKSVAPVQAAASMLLTEPRP